MKVRCIDATDSDELVVGGFYNVVGEHWGTDYKIEGLDLAWSKRRFVVEEETVPEAASVRNKYSREIKPGVFVDVYDVLRAFVVTDPSLQHLAKKALACGQRHHKDVKEDLCDILSSAKRAIEMYEEWENAGVGK